MALTQVPVAPLAPGRFRSILTEEQARALDRTIERAHAVLDGRAVWNVNSTAVGGGVAEMLHSLIAYTRGAGIDARWSVIEGDPAFFTVTKRIHNHLHGSPGDGGPLGEDERRTYEATMERNARGLSELVRAGDVVLLHDPQTAGLVEAMRAAGAHVVWRAHIGLDLPDDLARGAWAFLLPYVREADACVFSRPAFAWEGLPRERLIFIPPSIDAFSPKNQPLPFSAVAAILRSAGLAAGGPDGSGTFIHQDGTPGRVERRAELVEDVTLRLDEPLVVQVSRWDRLKDPVGVMEAFATRIAPHTPAHMVLAGPDAAAVADDPEGAEVAAEARAARERLPRAARERIHLAGLPMVDAEENAAIVNALQRRADVVVQKSLAEGFGLTVAEAMWKGRPVVASRVGGIQDQIEDGVSGFLVDPRDPAAFGAAVLRLLHDPELARRVGLVAQERVRALFLGPRHLEQYVALFERIVAGPARG